MIELIILGGSVFALSGVVAFLFSAIIKQERKKTKAAQETNERLVALAVLEKELETKASAEEVSSDDLSRELPQQVDLPAEFLDKPMEVKT